MASNNDSGFSFEGLFGDLSTIISACFIVSAVIIISIISATIALPLIFPEQVLSRSPSGALPPIGVWVSLITFQATAIGTILAIVKLTSPGSIRFKFALGWPRISLNGIILLFAIAVAVQVLLSFFAFTFFPKDVESDLSIFRDNIQDAPFILAFIALVIGAPVAEELLFRGYLMHQISQTRLGFSGATIVATTAWTLLHIGYSTIGLITVFFAGLLFSWVLWKTASIWVSIFLHAVYNCIALIYIIATQPPSAV